MANTSYIPPTCKKRLFEPSNSSHQSQTKGLGTEEVKKVSKYIILTPATDPAKLVSICLHAVVQYKCVWYTIKE